VSNEDYKNDPEKAAKDGVKGYIDVKLNGGDTTLSRKAIENNVFNITILFISYDPEIQYASLKLDPKNSRQKQCQMEGDKILCSINDCLSFSEQEITLKNGTPYSLKMYLDIPNNVLKAKMYITPTFGMSADYPIINEDSVKIDK